MVLSYADLCRIFDTKQRATLVRLMRARGVHFMLDRRGRPITTEQAITEAMIPKKVGFVFKETAVQKSRREARERQTCSESSAIRSSKT